MEGKKILFEVDKKQYYGIVHDKCTNENGATYYLVKIKHNTIALVFPKEILNIE